MPVRLIRRRLVVVVGLIAGLAGCSFAPLETEHVLQMPMLPSLWTESWGKAAFEVAWGGIGSELEVIGEAEPGSTIRVRTPIAAPTVFLAYPVWLSGGPFLAPGERFPPAGAVWPSSRRADHPNTISLTFADGPAAAILAHAFAAGVDLRDFNVPRFVSACRDVIAESNVTIDAERVLEALSERSMRESYIRAVQTERLEVAFPSGSWTPAVPGESMWIGPDQVEVSLSRGITAFYSPDRRRFAVSVDNEWRIVGTTESRY